MPSGTLKRGNAKNGILVTDGATGNLDRRPGDRRQRSHGGVFVRPPQGNLISGNRANGVLINDGATQTLLCGNFVGTTASGNSALGNRQDGVAIVKASGNQLIGCTYQQSPFVFYNVLERQRRQRPADHQFQQHDGAGQFHGRRRRQRHGRGQRRRRPPGIGFVARTRRLAA